MYLCSMKETIYTGQRCCKSKKTDKSSLLRNGFIKETYEQKHVLGGWKMSDLHNPTSTKICNLRPKKLGSAGRPPGRKCLRIIIVSLSRADEGHYAPKVYLRVELGKKKEYGREPEGFRSQRAFIKADPSKTASNRFTQLSMNNWSLKIKTKIPFTLAPKTKT